MIMTTTQNFRHLLFLSFALMLSGLAACTADATKRQIEEPEALPTQYLLLLDLSDRIKLPGQANRDMEIIRAIKDKFIQACKDDHILLSRNQFSLRIAAQKNNPLGLEETWFEDSLSLDLGAWDETERRPMLDAFNRNFDARLLKLYEKASTFPDEKMYQGADLWGYFRDELPIDISAHNNTCLYLLTDGYLDFEDPGNRKQQQNRYTDSDFLRRYRQQGWESMWEKNNEGILPTPCAHTEKLSLQILELYPKNEWQDEYPLLCAMWQKWMQENQIRMSEAPLRRDRPMGKILATL